MGRPLDPRKIGNTTDSGNQIRVRGILDIGTGLEPLYIRKQVNNSTYLCSDPTNTRTGRIKLQQATPTLVGQGRIAVSPYGAAAATATATMKAVSAVVVGIGSGHAPADVLTVVGGTRTTATKITVDTVNGGGGILTYHVSTVGNYTVLPSNPVATTSTGVGIGATFTIGWGVLAIAVVSGGSGYEDAPAVTITGGTGATATAVLTNGVVTSIVVGAAGSGFTATAIVTIGADKSYASVIESHLVKTFEGQTYRYDINVPASATGQADIEVA